MIKKFCDSCGDEMVKSNTPSGGRTGDRLATEVRGHDRVTVLSVELLTGKDGVANGGDFCKYCILDAFAKLDDRPKIAHLKAGD